MLRLILLVLVLPFVASAVDPAEICQQHRLVVSLKQRVAEIKKTAKKGDPTLKFAEDGAKEQDAELAKKLAQHKSETGKAYDVKACKSEENVANAEKLAKGSPSKSDAEAIRNHQRVISEPEAVQDACILKMQLDNSKNLMAAVPPAQQKELKAAQDKLGQMLKQKEAAFSKRHGKAIDYTKCPH